MGCAYDCLVSAPSTPPLRVRPRTPPALRPMPLLRLPEPFDHPDWLFEVKHDGFRALAHIDGHHCDLVSRNGHTFKHWPQLCEELAHAVKAHDAVIDGEIVCLDARGPQQLQEPAVPARVALLLRVRSARSGRRRPARVAARRAEATAAPTDPVSADAAAVRGPRRGTREGLLRGRVCARPRGHRGQARERSLPCGRHEHQLVQDQESRVHADDRAPRTLRAPNRVRASAVRCCASRKPKTASLCPVPHRVPQPSPEVLDQHQIDQTLPAQTLRGTGFFPAPALFARDLGTSVSRRAAPAGSSS